MPRHTSLCSQTALPLKCQTRMVFWRTTWSMHMTQRKHQVFTQFPLIGQLPLHTTQVCLLGLQWWKRGWKNIPIRTQLSSGKCSQPELIGKVRQNDWRHKKLKRLKIKDLLMNNRKNQMLFENKLMMKRENLIKHMQMKLLRKGD